MVCGTWKTRIIMENEALLLWGVLFSSIGLGFLVLLEKTTLSSTIYFWISTDDLPLFC